MLKEFLQILRTKSRTKEKWEDSLMGVAIDGYVTCETYGKYIEDLLAGNRLELDADDTKKLLLGCAKKLRENGAQYKATFNRLMGVKRHM